MIGQTLAGRFTVVGLVGVGSMGKVYRAVQRGTERSVALKVLRPERAREEKAKARFLREARACSSLASPHTVRVFDFGESDEGDLFLAMELLEGESLGQRLKRDGRVPVLAAIETALAACKSLEEAHAKGLIHRDLKPANLFYARVTTGGGGFDEILKVLDFGGAKFIAPGGKALNAMDTLEGFVVGTPRYMSPEQAEGKVLDGRSDLYSLGAVLYHMLTGRAPFTDDDPETVLAKQIRAIPDPPSAVCPDARISPELEAVVLRTLAKSPDRRPRNATALGQELAALIDAPASARLSSGVLRASLPPPGHAQAGGGAGRPSSSQEASVPASPGSSSSPSGSGRSLRGSPSPLSSASGIAALDPSPCVPSSPQVPAGAVSSPSGSGTSRAQRSLAPSTPAAFAPGASSSGSSGMGRAELSLSSPTAAVSASDEDAHGKDADGDGAGALLQRARPRRPARWVGLGGALAVLAAVAWLGSNAMSPAARRVAKTSTVSAPLGPTPASAPSGSSAAVVAPATARLPSNATLLAGPTVPLASFGGHVVPVDALPRARFESAPRRPMPKAHTGPLRPSDLTPAPLAAAAPVPVAPPPAATPPAEPLPASPPPPATAASPYHTFE